MSYYKLYITLSFFLTLPFLVKAQQKVENFTPSTIVLSQSKDIISMVKDGKTIALPKVDKKVIGQAWEKQDIDFSIFEESIAQIQDRIEMKTLSEKLGVRIMNPIHLSLYREAASWIGTRYRWAGSSEKGVDCSGLTGILLKTVYNKEIDRSSHIIATRLNEELDTKDLEPGDLVFFSTLRGKRISHVGVYLGDRQFIHASRQGVVVSSLDESYYSRSLRKAGRI